MKNELKKILERCLVGQNFDCLSLGVINFAKSSFFCLEHLPSSFSKSDREDSIYYDLASLTKPLTLGATYCKEPELFHKNDDLTFLLEHRGGLPAWGRLSKHDWRAQVLSFGISDSETKYSDFSALRLMLELEKKLGEDFLSLMPSYFDKETFFWKHLKDPNMTPYAGFRNGRPLRGQVHDDNAFAIDEFCTHAGLFSTVSGLCRTLLNLEKKYSLIKVMESSFLKRKGGGRFLKGWDTINPMEMDKTLAGFGCSPHTFGHLGFTGTSTWIDCEKSLGIVILTNATKNFWFERTGLNDIRRSIGSFVWKNYHQF